MGKGPVPLIMTENQYSIIPECSLQHLGGNHLLLVYPGNKDKPFALQVNESCALLLERVMAMASFSREDIISVLTSEYGLSLDEASRECDKTLDLWKELALI